MGWYGAGPRDLMQNQPIRDHEIDFSDSPSRPGLQSAAPSGAAMRCASVDLRSELRTQDTGVLSQNSVHKVSARTRAALGRTSSLGWLLLAGLLAWLWAAL